MWIGLINFLIVVFFVCWWLGNETGIDLILFKEKQFAWRLLGIFMWVYIAWGLFNLIKFIIEIVKTL